jgi:hypothetical protein
MLATGEEEECELKKRCRKLKTLKWARSAVPFAETANSSPDGQVPRYVLVIIGEVSRRFIRVISHGTALMIMFDLSSYHVRSLG